MNNLISIVEKLNGNIVLLVGLIGGILYLKVNFETFLKGALKDEFDAIHEDIETVSKKLDKVDENATQNFLVKCIADFDKGTEVNEAVRIRFWKQYDHYTAPKPDGLGKNSYIKTEVDRLIHEGKLSRTTE